MEKLTIAQIEAQYGDRLREAGLTAVAVNKRLERQHTQGREYDIEDALSPPRKQRKFEAFGEKLTMNEWAARYNISTSTLSQRLNKRGMTLEAALTEPLSSTRAAHGTLWSYDGQTMTMRQWARARDVRYVTLRAAVSRYMDDGMTAEEAMGKAFTTIERRGSHLVLDGERLPIETWATRVGLDVTVLRDRMDRGESLRAIMDESRLLTAFGVTAPLRNWADALQIKAATLQRVYKANKNKGHETILRMATPTEPFGLRNKRAEVLEAAVARLKEAQHATV